MKEILNKYRGCIFSFALGAIIMGGIVELAHTCV